MPASWGADALLYPSRRAVEARPKVPFDNFNVEGAGIRLKGWWFHAEGTKRGTVVYLHGTADNRTSGIGIADHFLAKGFDVWAYDSRAHGESEGYECTYGYYEKRDLSRVLDLIEVQPIIVLGVSLGAAVALQTAADEPRIAGVVAVAPFSDLRTVATERAPFVASATDITEALRLAEKKGRFEIAEVSPVAAASRINIPVLLIHGADDSETPAAHSTRIFAALREPKQLIVVPGAGHNDSLKPSVWKSIDDWLDGVVRASKR